MKNLFLVFSFALLLGFNSTAQQTLGVMSIEPAAYNGYTLFAPWNNSTTYLIDLCGNKVKQWESAYMPAASVYLLENGTLLRTGNLFNTTFNGSGGGGIIENFEWSGSLNWQITHSSDSFCLHHDIEYLPNGNILAIAWRLISYEKAVAAGRDTAFLHPHGIWSEQIVEFEIGASGNANIVWMWEAGDHLIQDFDSTKNNFGVIADHPERIDINYGILPNNLKDWLHFNAIDYNAELDQIVVSGIRFNEIWVIDHSTTTQEAKGVKGGYYGKGGDLLYRWGNPEAYGRGTINDKKIFGVHDVKWITNDCPDAGKLMYFNNGTNRPNGSYSSVDIIDQPVDADGFYLIDPNQPYGPTNLHWTHHQLGTSDDFYSAFMGGASQLPNGNILMCESMEGRFIEVDDHHHKVWEYITPVNEIGPMTQGDGAWGNMAFRATRLSPDYAGFFEQTLISSGPIELNPLPLICDTGVITQIATHELADVKLINNPVKEILNIENNTGQTIAIDVYNALGVKLQSHKIGAVTIKLNVAQLPAGVYYLRMMHINNGHRTSEAFVKR